MNKIVAIVVTYYPEKSLLLPNVNAFIDYVDKVLIWENTPNNLTDYRYFKENDKIEYCGGGINSISKALNYAWKYAVQNEYDYLLTMDQDSQWVNFAYYLSRTINNPDAPYGIYGPCVNDKIYEEEFYNHDLITSGMLVPVKILNEVNGYNESFRVDGIDTFLCYSVQEKGYGTYSVANCVLKQRFGNFGGTSFARYRFSTYNYPAIRLYEIFKSQIIIMRRFNTDKNYKKAFSIRIRKWPIKILLVENDKWNKLSAIAKGIIAGLFYNTKKMS